MKDTRIKNDIKVMWHILNEGAPYDIEGKDVSLYLITPFGKVKIDDFTIDKNVIHWTFFGKDQKTVGIYGLEMSINEDREGMVTTDKCKFVRLVAHSCMVGGADEGNVETETIELTSNLELGNGGSSYDDTAIWAEVGRLENDKADRTEVAELSVEVSGLSERIDNLPTAESSVFEAIPEVTPYEDILAAYEANKHIICKRFNYTYSVVRFYNNKFYFSCVSEAYANTMTCDSLNRWVFLGYELEKASNKTKTINAESTDTQYPSAKAVYDALQNVSGGESSVFEAEYGVTTYEEIVEARNAGKMVICVYNQLIYKLIRLTAERASFSVPESNTLYQLVCPKGGSWIRDNVNYTHKLENLADNNVKITIAGQTAEVATPQYVENLLGVIINGDY